MAESTGYVNHLNTDVMYEAVQGFDEAIKAYEDRVSDLKNIINKLLKTWEGDGRDEFEKDYKTFAYQLQDLMDVLLDLRKGLVDAESAYIETDSAVSKDMACN